MFRSLGVRKVYGDIIPTLIELYPNAENPFVPFGSNRTEHPYTIDNISKKDGSEREVLSKSQLGCQI